MVWYNVNVAPFPQLHYGMLTKMFSSNYRPELYSKMVFLSLRWHLNKDLFCRSKTEAFGVKTRATSSSSLISLFSTDSSSLPTDSNEPSSDCTKSKLSSSRSRHAVSLLPSYLKDARAIQKYHPQLHPRGPLQFSVAENQMSEVPVKKIRRLLEYGGEEVEELHEISEGEERNGMTLVDVLSQLAASSVLRPSKLLEKTGNHQTESRTSKTSVFESEMVYYQPTQGTPGLRKIMADYLQRLLVDPMSRMYGSASSTPSPVKPRINPDNIILGAGCNAVLENLCMCLTDPGDAVLIPTPYYAAFEFDLAARAGCHIVPVNSMADHAETNTQSLEIQSKKHSPVPVTSYFPNRTSLDNAFQRAVKETNRAPRVLLISHPNNPLGVCYPPEVVKLCIDWCREKEIHLISDEIYAGSVHRLERAELGLNGGQLSTFFSALFLAANWETHTPSTNDIDAPSKPGLGLGPYVHLVYALSKDFALSGLRVGVVYTENEEILFPLQKLNDLCQISSQTQLLVERLLSARVVTGCPNDATRSASNAGLVNLQNFVDVYLESNRSNIRNRCDKLQNFLDEMGIPYLPADSGLFVWMDFREFLSPLESGIDANDESLDSKEDRERQLYMSLMNEYGLVFTPGMSMRNEKAGFFRCVFTAASEEEFELGLLRIRKFVNARRCEDF